MIIPERIIEMLSSIGMKDLGMSLLKEYNVAAWACMANYTGWGPGPVKEAIEEMARNNYVNIGDLAKFKGMPDSPIMVISDIKLAPQPTNNAYSQPFVGSFYHTMITVTYWNKSRQEINTFSGRIECFDIINPKK